MVTIIILIKHTCEQKIEDAFQKGAKFIFPLRKGERGNLKAVDQVPEAAKKFRKSNRGRRLQ